MSDNKKPYQKGWFADTDFWVNYGPLMFNPQSWEDAWFDIKNLIKLTHLKSGMNVMDSCCGVGRHSIELAKSGMKVTGIDITAPYIEAATETAGDMELDIDFVCDDVRKYVKKDHFDLAVNLYTSYGYFESQSDEEKYLQNIFDSLKSGGRFLIDTISKEALARDFVEDEWFEEEGNLICLGFEIIEEFSRLVNRWMIVSPDGTRQDYKFSHKIYSAVEIRLILSAAGFIDIEVFGSMEGDVYDHKVKRLIVSAKRP